MPAGQVDLVEVALGGNELEGAGVEALVHAGLAQVEADFDVGVELEPVVAEVALGLLLDGALAAHLILKYIIAVCFNSYN